MSSYKRFISYVYEYENNQKSSNRGFMKVECRSGICQMLFSLRGLCKDGNGSVKIYAFRRDTDHSSLSHLSTQEVFGGILNLHLQFSDMDIGSAHFALDELSGILFACSQHICYLTQWDDDALDIQQLFSYGESVHTPGSAPSASKESIEKDAHLTPTTTPPEIPLENARESISETPSESASKDTHSSIHKIAPEPVSDESDTPVSDTPSEISEDICDDTSTDDDIKNPRQNAADLHATSTETSAKGEIFPCFKDGSIINCVKITSKDIKRLHPKDWHLSSNRFVHYGQQVFGHLLVAQLAASGETILCVPGTYHQQECFMANMFGFPYFVPCTTKKNSRFCFGYWYRTIHPTDLNNKHGS